MRTTLGFVAITALIVSVLSEDVEVVRKTHTSNRQDTINAQTSMEATSAYCSCNHSSIYLDIVFVIDTSDEMTQKTVGDATATIQSTLYGLTLGRGHFQSNVAALAFADTVQIVSNFDDLRSNSDIGSFSPQYLGGNSTRMAGAISKASSMITASGRTFTRKVIVLLSNTINQPDITKIRVAADAFTDDGGIFITIDYSEGSDDLGVTASPGYYFNDASKNLNLASDLLSAFCDANCFCPDDLFPLPDNTERGMPTSCYRVASSTAVYDAADSNCKNQGGFVATVHDDMKQFFMLTLFPTKSKYWIGLKWNGTNYEWADGVEDGYTDWASGNPLAGQDCVYSQQQTGFASAWFSAPCDNPLKYSLTYACQLRPCDSEYDCWT